MGPKTTTLRWRRGSNRVPSRFGISPANSLRDPSLELYHRMSIGRHQDGNPFAILYYYSNAVHRATSVAEVCELGLTALEITLNVGRTSVLLNRDGVQFRASRAIHDDGRIDSLFPWPLDSTDPQPLLVADLSNDPTCEALRDVLTGEGIQSIAFIPILNGGELMGRFILYYGEPHTFTFEEVGVAQTIASHVGFAAERQRVEEALRGSQQLLEAILEGEKEVPELEPYLVPALVAAASDGGDPIRPRFFYRKDPADFPGSDSVTKGGGAGLPDPNDFGTPRGFGLTKDLRSRNRLQDTLRESEERFRAMSACSPVGLLMVDAQGHCLYSNARCQAICGFKLREGLGNGWFRFIHDDDMPTFSLQWAQFLKEGRQFQIECRFRNREGVVRSVELKTTPLFYDGDRIAGYVSTVEDVSAHRAFAVQQNQLLKHSEFLARAAQQLSGSLEYDATIRTLSQLAVSMLSDWCEIYATDRQSGLRKLVVTHRNPDNATWTEMLQRKYASTTELHDVVQNALKKRETTVLHSVTERALAAKDGEHLRILRNLGVDTAMAVPLIGRTEVLGVLIMFSAAQSNRNYGPEQIAIGEELAARAILAIESALLYRKAVETQGRMTFLAEFSKTMMASTNYDTTFSTLAQMLVPLLADFCLVYKSSPDGTSFHRMALRHMDAGKEKLLADLPIETVHVSDDTTFGHALQTRRAVIVEDPDDGEWPFVDLQPESAMIVPLCARGHHLGVLVMMLGDSGRVYTKADLAMTEELASRAALVIDNTHIYAQAQEANRIKEEFLATLSHELRTPLTAIVGYARLLMAGKLDPAGAEQAIQCLYRNAQLQSQLISDLLDISRIATGKLKLVMEPVDLNGIIKSALDSVKLAADAKSIRLTYKADPFAANVIGDADRLQQIIWNLVSNAIKFTPAKGRIEVRLIAMGPYAEIKVVDNGAGVSPEFLPHVFEKFRQADTSAARTNGGLGLGLAIVRHLVEMHGGLVKAESKGVGLGATFTVRLPLR